MFEITLSASTETLPNDKREAGTSELANENLYGKVLLIQTHSVVLMYEIRGQNSHQVTYPWVLLKIQKNQNATLFPQQEKNGPHPTVQQHVMKILVRTLQVAHKHI